MNNQSDRIMKYIIAIERQIESNDLLNIWFSNLEENQDKKIKPNNLIITINNFWQYFQRMDIRSFKADFIDSYIRFDREVSKIVYRLEYGDIDLIKEINDDRILNKLIENQMTKFLNGEGKYLTIVANWGVSSFQENKKMK